MAAKVSAIDAAGGMSYRAGGRVRIPLRMPKFKKYQDGGRVEPQLEDAVDEATRFVPLERAYTGLGEGTNNADVVDRLRHPTYQQLADDKDLRKGRTRMAPRGRGAEGGFGYQYGGVAYDPDLDPSPVAPDPRLDDPALGTFETLSPRFYKTPPEERQPNHDPNRDALDRMRVKEIQAIANGQVGGYGHLRGTAERLMGEIRQQEPGLAGGIFPDDFLAARRIGRETLPKRYPFPSMQFGGVPPHVDDPDNRMKHLLNDRPASEPREPLSAPVGNGILQFIPSIGGNIVEGEARFEHPMKGGWSGGAQGFYRKYTGPGAENVPVDGGMGLFLKKKFRAGGPVPRSEPDLLSYRNIKRGYRPGVKDKPAKLRTMPYDTTMLDKFERPDSDTYTDRWTAQDEEPDWVPNYQHGGITNPDQDNPTQITGTLPPDHPWLTNPAYKVFNGVMYGKIGRIALGNDPSARHLQELAGRWIDDDMQYSRARGVEPQFSSEMMDIVESSDDHIKQLATDPGTGEVPINRRGGRVQPPKLAPSLGARAKRTSKIRSFQQGGVAEAEFEIPGMPVRDAASSPSAQTVLRPGPTPPQFPPFDPRQFQRDQQDVQALTPHYPSSMETANARNVDAFYGDPYSGVYEGREGSTVGMIPSRNVAGKNWAQLAATPDRQQQVPPYIADHLSKGRLAANKSALVGLSYDPTKMALTPAPMGGIGGIYDKGADRMWADVNPRSPSNIVHESAHRSLEKLRGHPAMKNVGGAYEESMVRAIMQKYYGGELDAGEPPLKLPSEETKPYRQEQATAKYNMDTNPDFRRRLQELERAAAQEIYKKRPYGGPR